MARLRKPFLSVALVAALLHGLVLAGCGGGGGSSSTGPSAGAELRLRFSGLAAPRAVSIGARSAAAAGATVNVDGSPAGVTDAGGEIVLQLAPGTYTITVDSGGVISAPFLVTVAEGDVVTLEVEIAKDGTLVVEQDKDRDGDYDDDDEDDDKDHVDGTDDDDDDEADDDDGDHEEGAGGHTNGSVTTR
jgi:hypothetical protein